MHGPLAKFIMQVGVFIDMLADYQSGKYRKAPAWTIGVVAFVLLYILIPFDAVPDFIPFAGLVDDALVMAVGMAMIDRDIRAYESWRKEERSKAEQAASG